MGLLDGLLQLVNGGAKTPTAVGLKPKDAFGTEKPISGGPSTIKYVLQCGVKPTLVFRLSDGI